MAAETRLLQSVDGNSTGRIFVQSVSPVTISCATICVPYKVFDRLKIRLVKTILSSIVACCAMTELIPFCHSLLLSIGPSKVETLFRKELPPVLRSNHRFVQMLGSFQRLRAQNNHTKWLKFF